ncbi:MerR family transcriptional regulator [Comamonas piscis]|uniref:MerR family transcriptional regulator n=1 Tax=Comamonas piscis TaxID=1562974 RepID=A0A7G5EDR3_9BURK|nr:MerR family transcriptional regulator [Comamonas piscis]QMV72138.1 MerR family transcriptional regulator [Comamonas piscis]WSO34888.1 MerR family transcriptional regulator [Comamonas piscis]
MEPPLSIEEAAQRTGLSAHTLRYYERIGLIAAVPRAAGGQRRYAAADLAWLAFLTRLRTTRMPIQKMRQFAQLRSAGDASVPARRQMLQTHLAEVQAEIAAMQQAAQALQAKIAHYQALEASASPAPHTTANKDLHHD